MAKVSAILLLAPLEQMTRSAVTNLIIPIVYIGTIYVMERLSALMLKMKILKCALRKEAFPH